MTTNCDIPSDEVVSLTLGKMRRKATHMPTDSMKRDWLKLLFSIAVVLLSCAGESAAPSFGISLKRAEDAVEILLSERAAAFILTSRTGIGQVHITSYGDQWPDTVQIRLQYNGGRGFHRLESFTVETDSLLARTALGRSGPVPLYCIDAHTRVDSSAICGKTVIPLSKQQDFIEATVPRVFLGKGANHITISWVDMYRH